MELKLEPLEGRLLLATRTWTGNGPTSNWTHPANWSGGVAPQAGDDLVFPPSTPRSTSDNNYPAGTAFSSITNQGCGYVFRGNSIILSGTGPGGLGALYSSCDSNWQIPIHLAGPTTFGAAASQGLLVHSVISGPAAATLTKTGPGSYQFLGANNYAGQTVVAAGTLTVAHASGLGLGGAAGGTTVLGGAGLELRGVTVVDERLTLNDSGFASHRGALYSWESNSPWNGPVTLDSPTAIGATAGRTLTLGGAISGLAASPWTKRDAGTVVLAGPNNYAGNTFVEVGTVVASHTLALGTAASGTTVGPGAALELRTGGATIDEPLTLDGAEVRLFDAGGTWGGAVALAGPAMLTVTAGASWRFENISGPSSATLTKSGPGTLTLDRPNAYAGATVVSAGVLAIRHAAALGTSPAEVTVQDGARLELQGGITVNKPLTLNGFGGGRGALTSARDGNNWSGRVTLASTAAVGAASDAVTGVVGVISGPGGLTKVGDGLVWLRGPNSYDGATAIDAGVLQVERGNGIPDLSPVTLGPTARLELFANETIGSLAGGGTVILGSSTLTAGGNNASTTYVGLITGAGGLTKAGTGTLTLSGANPYAGPTIVSAGTLLVNGAQSGSAVTVGSGATLGGTGTAGPVAVSAGGRLAPGASPGILHTAGVTFAAGVSFVVELNGLTPGSGYDQLHVSGAVNLGGATLSGTLGFVPAVGAPFVVIANDGTDPVAGSFAGLPEGTSFMLGGRQFRVTYRGGDGNDVSLVAGPLSVVDLGPPVRLPAVRFPLGGGGSPGGAPSGGGPGARSGLVKPLGEPGFALPVPRTVDPAAGPWHAADNRGSSRDAPFLIDVRAAEAWAVALVRETEGGTLQAT